MEESIHGHEVLRMIMDSGVSYTKESLEKAIMDKFGAEARFHTCSAERMTAKDLVEFLESRGKFKPSDGGFTADPDKICDHDG